MPRKSGKPLEEAHAVFAEFQASRPGERLSREVWVEYCEQHGRADLAGMYDVVQPAPRVPRWRIGQQLFGDELTIVSVLGRGGMGEVFLAKNDRYLQNALPTMVALKRPIRRQQDLPRARTDEDGLTYLETFIKEVGHWVDLNGHSSIVRLLGFRCDREYDFLNLPQLAMVLEYVDGWSLDTAYGQSQFPWLNGRLDTRGAISIAKDVARALEYAHGRDIAHGDVKPSNILVSKDAKRALLTDFGLARSIKAIVSRGRGYGTPGFSAPEQMGGESHDPRKADVYALGLTILSLYSGSRQWRARPDGTVDAAALIEERRSLLGDGVARILLRACELNPERRMTMGQLLFSLQQLASAFPHWTPQEAASDEQYQRARPRADEPLRVLKDLFQLGKRYARLRARIEAEIQAGRLTRPDEIGAAAGALLSKLDRYLEYRQSPTGVRWCLDELQDLLRRSNDLAGPGVAAILDLVMEYAEEYVQHGRSCEAESLARVVLNISEMLKVHDEGGDIARVRSRVEQWQARVSNETPGSPKQGGRKGRSSDAPAATSTPIRVAKGANRPLDSAANGVGVSEEEQMRALHELGKWLGDIHRAILAAASTGSGTTERNLEKARYAFGEYLEDVWAYQEKPDTSENGRYISDTGMTIWDWLRNPQKREEWTPPAKAPPGKTETRAAIRGLRALVLRELSCMDPEIDLKVIRAFDCLARALGVRLTPPRDTRSG